MSFQASSSAHLSEIITKIVKVLSPNIHLLFWGECFRFCSYCFGKTGVWSFGIGHFTWYNGWAFRLGQCVETTNDSGGSRSSFTRLFPLPFIFESTMRAGFFLFYLHHYQYKTEYAKCTSSPPNGFLSTNTSLYHLVIHLAVCLLIMECFPWSTLYSLVHAFLFLIAPGW